VPRALRCLRNLTREARHSLRPMRGEAVGMVSPLAEPVWSGQVGRGVSLLLAPYGDPHFGSARPHLLRNGHAPVPILLCLYHDDSERLSDVYH
jgi:hypothetical protein